MSILASLTRPSAPESAELARRADLRASDHVFRSSPALAWLAGLLSTRRTC
ncbi:hypothetical protein ABZ619_40045 [Streptomyces sp. NPDC007851]|uniref:hypothetical protein n=1 Tax=Streptomyces sp. NPDC007851 TaxID=3155008 RepID=UPI0033C4C01F